MLQFKKVELEDIEIFKKYMQREDELSCENAFVNLLVWQCAYNNMWAEYEGQLFIKSGSGEKQSFRLPIGGNLQRGIEIIEEYCGKKPFIWAQNGKNFKNFRETFSESFEFIENRNAFDYIYLRDALADLSGKKYHSKRNHISAFSKKHNWRYEKITDSNIGEIKSCAESWYRENKERLKDSMLCEQK